MPMVRRQQLGPRLLYRALHAGNKRPQPRTRLPTHLEAAKAAAARSAPLCLHPLHAFPSLAEGGRGPNPVEGRDRWVNQSINYTLFPTR